MPSNEQCSLQSLRQLNLHNADRGEGCDLLAEKTHRAIKNETLAALFAIAQQTSVKVSCKAAFQVVLFVHHLSFHHDLTLQLQEAIYDFKTEESGFLSNCNPRVPCMHSSVCYAILESSEWIPVMITSIYS